MALGTASLAQQIAEAHLNRYLQPDLPGGWRELGSGQQRAVYLHEPTNTVYKVGLTPDLDGCNRYEHRTLAKLRTEGHDHAPDTSLFEVEVDDWENLALGVEGSQTRAVIAMPYLPEDHSVPHDETWMPGMADLNPDNIHAHGGKLWLIDAGGL